MRKKKNSDTKRKTCVIERKSLIGLFFFLSIAQVKASCLYLHFKASREYQSEILFNVYLHTLLSFRRWEEAMNRNGNFHSNIFFLEFSLFFRNACRKLFDYHIWVCACKTWCWRMRRKIKKLFRMNNKFIKHMKLSAMRNGERRTAWARSHFVWKQEVDWLRLKASKREKSTRSLSSP